tara:strand:+ start:158 stop:808 length:651 start_codon:yes stop_codon:yes gene_type:complete
MPNIPNKKLKCFMRRAKNGAVYRACAVPEKDKKPKKQVRGNPIPEGKRKLPVKKAYPDRPSAPTQAPNRPKVKLKVVEKKKEASPPKPAPKKKKLKVVEKKKEEPKKLPAKVQEQIKKGPAKIKLYKNKLLKTQFDRVANPNKVPYNDRVVNYLMTQQGQLKARKAKEKGEAQKDQFITPTEMKEIVKKTLVRYKDEAKAEKRRGEKPTTSRFFGF